MDGGEYWIPAFRGYDALGLETKPLSLDLPCLFRQHDRDAIADRIGELCRARDQLLPCCVKLQRTLGQRADQDFQQFGIDGAFKAFGRGGHGLVSGFVSDGLAYSIQSRCRTPYRWAIRSSSSSTACCFARGNGFFPRAYPRTAQQSTCA